MSCFCAFDLMTDPHQSDLLNPANVSVLQWHGTLFLSFPRYFTVCESTIFRNFLGDYLSAQKDPIRRIIFDFSRTEFIDSCGLGSLMINIKLARARSIPLAAWSLGSQVRLAFSLAGLDQIIPITANTQAIYPVTPFDIKERNSLTHPSVRSRTKRFLDIIGSLIGLFITLMLFPLIAIAIRLDQPGPIFFSQIRIGWMGRRFRLWKFRSMVTNAEALRDQVLNEASGAIFKNHNDPRITRVGKFLRRTSLDEFPQFWNVLNGDMSLIGTRPPTIDEVECYAVPNWQRFDVRPGMSGEWQVYGRSEIHDFEDVIRLDLRYQQRWSLGYDLFLIARTLVLLLSLKSRAV
jgi:anti-anti-sigma factor